MPLPMKSLLLSLLLTPALIFSQAILAAEVNLNVFLGANPLKDVDVELDGKVIGITDATGGLSAELVAGEHRLRLLKLDAALTDYRFVTRDGESADLSFTFTDFEQPALVALDTYDASSGEGGEPGIVEGYVIDAEGYALPGATVRIEQADAEVVTDDTGAFSFEVPRGSYTLSVTHPGHEPARQTGLRVIANVGVATRIALKPKVETFGGGVQEQEQELGGAAVAQEAPAAAGPAAEAMVGSDGVQEITVVGTFKPAQQTTAEIERFASGVTDAISVEDLLRFGDSDVAASLKRIVGISISEGKYAVVRGLDGRYIAATLNGNLMPGTDPFRRDVQLDLFPSDILAGIEIQKNFSAELPGETTGGIIQLATRGMPEGDVNKLGFSLGFVNDVTGEDLYTYEGSDTDDFGFDDGLRDLPGAIDAATRGGLDFSICQVEGQTNCTPLDEAAGLAALLPNTYSPKLESAAPDFGLSYTLGKVFDRDIGEVGLYGTASYDSSHSSRIDASINDLDTASNYSRDGRNITATGYFVAGLKTSADTELLSKTMLLRNTEETTEVEAGFDKDSETNFRRFLLEWEERQFFAQQFQGEHFLFDGEHRLEWRAGISQATRQSPDRRSYTFLGNNLALSTVERSYSDLTEDGIDFGVDYTLPLQITDRIKTKVSVGALGNVREREVELVRIGVRQGANPGTLSGEIEDLLAPANFANDQFRLNARSTLTDSYDGEQESYAGYVSTQTDIGDKLTLVAGLRQDEFTQDLSFPNAPNNPASLESNELLPSFSALYRFNDELQVRAAYAGTVSRPNITEIAPSVFYDERGRQYIGCATCEASTIDNFDLRAEYYFDDRDSISIALFVKDIDQPLERSVNDGSGSNFGLTFRNNESATVEGIELDMNKTVVDTSEHLLSIGGNLAFIESEIELDDVGQRLERDPKRDLQGQSPFLANLQVAHDYFPWRQKATLLVNFFDDRIDIVTRNQAVIEESGRLIVNFNYEKEMFSNSKLSLKVKNLLDEDVEYTQGGAVIESYKEGTAISLGYSVNFD